MGFFTRFPEAIRHLGMPWQGRRTSQTPLAMATLSSGSHLAECSATPVPNTAVTGAIPLKLRTICTSEGRGGQRSKSMRVVISGRMADVCAELDRLAALEAQPTLH